MIKSLRSLMRNDHREIEKIISQATERSIISDKTCQSLCRDFFERLTRHMSVEEKAIFDISAKFNNEYKELSRRIFLDHGKLRSTLLEIKSSLKAGKDFDLKEVLEQLKNHHNFEDSKFYPKLEKLLSKSEQIAFIETVEGKQGS